MDLGRMEISLASVRKSSERPKSNEASWPSFLLSAIPPENLLIVPTVFILT